MKRAMSKRGTASSVTAQEAAELLHFCFGDIYDPEAAAAGSAQVKSCHFWAHCFCVTMPGLTLPVICQFSAIEARAVTMHFET